MKPLKFSTAMLLTLAVIIGVWATIDRSTSPLRPEQYVKTLVVSDKPDGITQAIAEIEAYLEKPIVRRTHKFVRSFIIEKIGTFTAGIARRKMSIAGTKLREGETETAITLLEDVKQFYDENPGELKSNRRRKKLYSQLSIAYMRMGEQQNCLHNPSGAMCIVPFNEEAVHQLREGSTKASKLYNNVMLKADPGDFASKWLLNMAHITLGEYPDKVPEEYRLPVPGIIKNYEGPRYRNISEFLGVADQTTAGSVALEDFNGDGFFDIFVTQWHLNGRVKFYLRQSDGTFEDHTKQAGLNEIYGGLNVIHGDYNNDGFSDIYIIRGAWRNRRGAIPNSLLKNNGDGTFTDVTVKSGLLDFAPSITSAFADVNNDGWLDLVIANEATPTRRGANNLRLFINNRDGSFSDKAADANFTSTCHGKGLAVADYDNNRTQDIFVSCMGGENLLFANSISETGNVPVFKEISKSAGVQHPISSFASWFFDFDNDGDEDLFVAGYGLSDDDSASKGTSGAMGGSFDPGYSSAVMGRSFAGQEVKDSNPKLYSNNGDGTFTNLTRSMNLNHPYFAMGANFGDFDNDGWLDIYLGTGAPSYQSIYPNAALQNLNGQTFRDITGSSGLGHVQKGHGLAFADFDHDGDQDIFAQLGGALPGDIFQNALFENVSTANNWLKLNLVGTKSNRSAIGARIEVHVSNPNGTNRTIYRTVGSGGSFGSAPMTSEIGLGVSNEIMKITIRWPTSNIKQEIGKLDVNRSYRIQEGNTQAIPLERQPLSFRPPRQSANHKHH